MEAILAAILASPEIIISLVVEVAGFFVHAFTGSVHTVADATGCLIEGEVQKAGLHIVDQSLAAIGDRIDLAQQNLNVPTTLTALVDTFGSNIGETIKSNAEQILHVNEGSTECAAVVTQ